MFCPNCGNQTSGNADVCLYCGSLLKNNTAMNNYNNGGNDKSNVGLNLISFFVPLIGLILYITLKKDTPIKAKSCGKSALFGFISGIVISIVSFIFLSMMAANTVNNQIDEARKKSLSYYSKSVVDKVQNKYYLDRIYNDIQGEKCYNISELYGYDLAYKGSVKIEQNGNSTNIKVWITYDGLYSITEYENGISIGEEIVESSNVNLTCRD